MNPVVYDAGDGIDLAFEYDHGITVTYHLTDAAAEQLISIMRNKLNGRFKREP